MKLFMLLLGATPENRFTEQHDVFFGIANTLPELVPAIQKFWPEGKGLHLDAWREVTEVDGFSIDVIPNMDGEEERNNRLFFLNLGGYKKNEFEEYHYKMLAVAVDKAEAIRKAKETAFYKHTGFKGAESHIDDKYGIDVDDVYAIEDILPEEFKSRYRVRVKLEGRKEMDEIHLGYFRVEKLASDLKERMNN